MVKGDRFEAERRTDVLRRTTVELGPLRIVREVRLAPLPIDYPFVDAPRARTGGGWRAAGMMGVLMAVSAGGLSFAATRAPAPRQPSYSVSLPVPQRVIPPARPLPVARVAKQTVPVAKATAAPVADDLPADSGSRAIAIAAALRSGEVQEWYEAAGQVHGFVVAGDAEQDGAQTCRALSVLTRAPGGADKVDQRRECLPDAG
ncbi:hypothetical protein [Sphingomonas endophytica]|uniref:Uncharacterized protein n=1 Tax=Sphingomonas endophytica TaxID=869719 RepID=A0A147I5P2_9SPHN|nr:hypothetical protein [Sphingomonas endophytica]KTT74071.1 hypothetical protein NS334_05750 [Sphingomonas endophytica]